MPHHVVVDGSNLATEGRTAPSLKQLNEAVLAYMAEDPTALITVVVDATFGHRIDPKEVAEFDAAVSNNELVAPPAGAIGRGDAFVLSIAHKVNANILTNDSYQEFHAQYDWLFDEGRLIGGKPVPHIGWVFVKRLPVRGPLSRKVTSEAKRKSGGATTRGRGRSEVTDATVRIGSPEANLPMPVPKAPPPRGAAKPADTKADAPASKGRRGRGGDRPPAEAAAVATEAAAAPAKSTVNDLLSFLTFVERHPAGTSVSAVVDHYSSHGAYVRIGDVVGYVPLRLMANPAPRSAREFMKVGEAVTLVVDSFVPAKRSVDLAIPGMGSVAPVAAAAEQPAKAAKASKAAKTTKATKATKAAAAVQPADVAAPAAADEAPATPAKPARGGRKAASKGSPAELVDAPSSVTPVAPAAPVAPRRAKAAASGGGRGGSRRAPEVPDEPVSDAARRRRSGARLAAAEVAAAAAEAPAPVKKAAAKKAAAAPAAAKKAAAPAKAAAKKAKPAAAAEPKKAAPARRGRTGA
jgi:hypothetical protein